MTIPGHVQMVAVESVLLDQAVHHVHERRGCRLGHTVVEQEHVVVTVPPGAVCEPVRTASCNLDMSMYVCKRRPDARRI